MVFLRDYSFEEEDNIIPLHPVPVQDTNEEVDGEYIVICKNSSGKTYIGPFSYWGAESWAANSPYKDCKHKVVQLFDPESV
jgi:hypothetical protein